MKNTFFHIIFTSLSIILGMIAFILFFLLDFKCQVFNDGGNRVAIISNFVAIFGGVKNVTIGHIVDGNFVFSGYENLILNFAFDYLTFIGLCFCLISFIFMNINFNRKTALLISTVLNSLTLIYLYFQIQFFLLVNDGRSQVLRIFNIDGASQIISYGLIAFLSIFIFLDLINYIRVILLFKRKVTID